MQQLRGWLLRNIKHIVRLYGMPLWQISGNNWFYRTCRMWHMPDGDLFERWGLIMRQVNFIFHLSFLYLFFKLETHLPNFVLVIVGVKLLHRHLPALLDREQLFLVLGKHIPIQHRLRELQHVHRWAVLKFRSVHVHELHDWPLFRFFEQCLFRMRIGEIPVR